VAASADEERGKLGKLLEIQDMAKDGFFQRLWTQGSRPRRRGRACAPSVVPLEGRVLQALYVAKWVVNVHPGLLPPTKDAFLPVHVYGQIASTRSESPQAFFFVTDEYRSDEPSGPIKLGPSFPVNNYFESPFDFTFYLQATRSTNTQDGRHYDIFIGAKDKDNTDGKTIAVYVPKAFPPAPVQITARSHTHPSPHPHPHQTRPRP
jgi:hypothetical protein